MDPLAFIASVAASVTTVGIGYFGARKFQKLGGGEAQLRLNAIRKDLDDAMTEKVTVLEGQFAACKTRLIEVEKTVETLRKERRALEQEIHNLREDVRRLSPDRKGRTDRTDD